MNHDNNQNQSHQNNITPLTVIDLTKENAFKATNACYSISPTKKQRRPEIINESTDTRPQKRSRTEVQEHKPFFQNIIHLSSNREILPIPRVPTQTSIGTQSSYILPNNPILPPPLNYPQYAPHSQNFNVTSTLNGLKNLDQPYNIGMMSPTTIQIPPIASNPSPNSFSSTNSRSSSIQNSQEIIDLTNDSSDDNDCVIDEQETNRDVCWGMIDTEILILYPRPCTDGKGEEEVQLRREWGKKQGKISLNH
jgi:hypothetical protein